MKENLKPLLLWVLQNMECTTKRLSKRKHVNDSIHIATMGIKSMLYTCFVFLCKEEKLPYYINEITCSVGLSLIMCLVTNYRRRKPETIFHEEHLTSWCFPYHALFYLWNDVMHSSRILLHYCKVIKKIIILNMFSKERKRNCRKTVNLWNLWYPSFIYQVTTIGLQGQVDLSSPESFSRPRHILTTEGCGVNGQ